MDLLFKLLYFTVFTVVVRANHANGTIDSEADEPLFPVRKINLTTVSPKIVLTNASFPPSYSSLALQQVVVVAQNSNNFDLPPLDNSSLTHPGNESDEESDPSSYISSPLCVQLHPGLEMITRGIDISKLDLTDENGDMGTVGKIFDFACTTGGKQSIKQPDSSNVEYSIPDHFIVHPQLSSQIPNAASIIYNLVRMREEMGAKIGDDDSLPKGAFSEASTYKHFLDAVTNSSQFLTSMKAMYSVFTVTVDAPKEVLSRRFKSAYNRLPLSYGNDPVAVKNFVKSYGTHYFEKATFGGMIHFTSRINVALRELMPESAVVQVASNNYKKSLEGKGGLKNFHSEDNELFKQNARTKINYFGGDLNLLAQNKFNEWKESLAVKPYPLSVVIKPITDLMPEGSKKEAVRQAINDYLGEIYLNDLLRMLKSSIYQQSSTAADANYYIFKIQQHLDSFNHNSNDIETLGAEVEKWAFTPKWFLENVQLNFKITSYQSYECSLSETLIPINVRSPLPSDENGCWTFLKGLSIRIRTVGQTDPNFIPSHFIISAKINPYRITFRLSPLAYKNQRVPAWVRFLRFCVYTKTLIKCLKLEDTTYFDRSYEGFQVALKTTL